MNADISNNDPNLEQTLEELSRLQSKVQNAEKFAYRSRAAISSLIALLAAGVGITLAVYTAQNILQSKKPSSQPVTYSLVESMINEAQMSIGSDFEGVYRMFDEVYNTLSESENASKDYSVAQLKSELNSIKSELTSIETALGSELEQSLAIPLVRKDMTQLEVRMNERTINLAQDVDRVYDLNKWLIGLMATLTLGLLSLAAINIQRSNK